MNRALAERKVLRLLRETAMGGSPREIPPHAPLGADGVGLDSLALVEFVLRFEKKFRVQVPVDIWERKEEITASYFIDILTRGGKTPTP